jgi:hypothetical protein
VVELTLAFSDDTYYPVGIQPTWIGATDFDGDLHLDLLTVNTDEVSSVSFLSGNGDGTFAPAQTVATGFTERNGDLIRATVGDVDGDGRGDLFVPWRHEHMISVYWGGDVLSAPQMIPADGPESIALADFNGDDLDDLVFVSARFDARIGVCLQNVDHSFPDPTYFSIGTYSAYVLVGQYNDDSAIDLLLLGSDLVWMAGDGQGAFTEMARDLEQSASSDGLLVADFVEDGFVDLLMTFSGTNSKGLLPSTGRTSFSDALQLYMGSGYGGATGDFDRDGHADVILQTGGNIFSVRRGNGDGTFPDGLSLPIGCGSDDAFAVGDFNEDGLLDIAVAFSCDAVGVLLNESYPANRSIGFADR